MEKLNVITDAELINQYAQAMEAEPAESIETQAPSIPLIKLVAGAVVDGNLETEVEVRELNGLDEEAIAKTDSIGRALTVILNRGAVSIGGKPITEDILNNMLSGDRDMILLGIRQATFGNTVLTSNVCDDCGEDYEATVDLSKDVPIKEFDGQWSWEVKTGLGTATVGYYNGLTQKKIMENLDKNSAELNTLVLAGCIQALDDRPIIASDVAKRLGMKDREKILLEVLQKNPGPRLLEVMTACKACGHKNSVPLSLAALFRL